MSRMGYMNWLISQVDIRDNYSMLFTHLFNTDYRYTIENDSNRALDGVDLRYLYIDQTGDTSDLFNVPCNMLELLCAIARRIESVATCVEFDDRTAEWFWIMIDNLGLGKYDNAHYDGANVDFLIERFINHEYEPNGEGGLFTINNPRMDLRRMDIWYQICCFTNQILPKSNY